jgi:hypothetical protein
MRVTRFEDLEIWKLARDLYKIVKKEPIGLLTAVTFPRKFLTTYSPAPKPSPEKQPIL